MDSSQPRNPGDGQPDGQNLWRILQDTSDDSPVADAEVKAKPAVPPYEEPVGTKPPPPAEPQGITQIERILSDPESAAELVDFSSAATREHADYDSAVRSFYRDAEVSVMCKNHPERHSVQQCPECQAYYCQECLVVRRGRMVCRDCAVAIFVPSEEDILTAQEYGTSDPAREVTPEEHPEFQVGGALLGMEGRPAHPFKRVLALLLDLLLTRGLVLILAWILGGMFNSQPSAFFHLFDESASSPVFHRVFSAAVLLRPFMPWLVVFAIVDYIYFFVTLSFFNRTMGMSWLSCRVVTEWGDYVHFGAVALRTLVFMICLGWPSILLASVFPAYRGPHDYAAGTVVINYSGVKRIDSYDTVQIKLD
ncbi:RDD family protein [bacterium]|nr:RDD family protein [bacterium]